MSSRSVKQKWLHCILRFSGTIHRSKEKLLRSASIDTTLLISCRIILQEFLLLFISLPAFFFIAPERAGIDTEQYAREIRHYHLRRKVALATLGGLFALFLIKLSIVFSVSLYVEPNRNILAGETYTASWDFTNAQEYEYDQQHISFWDGIVVLQPTIDQDVKQDQDEVITNEEENIETNSNENISDINSLTERSAEEAENISESEVMAESSEDSADMSEEESNEEIIEEETSANESPATEVQPSETTETIEDASTADTSENSPPKDEN